MIGFKIVILIAVSALQASAQPNCQLMFQALGNIDTALSNPANIQPLAQSLNLNPNYGKNGLQWLLYNYYNQQSPNAAFKANNVVFTACGKVFNSYVTNAAINAQLGNPQYKTLNPPTTCFLCQTQTTLTLNPSQNTLSWGSGQVSFAAALTTIFSVIRSEISSSAVYNGGRAIEGNGTNACGFWATWLQQKYIESQLGLSYCALNDWLFQSVGVALSWPSSLQTLATSLGVGSTVNNESSITSVINSYLNYVPSRASAVQDFLASCDQQVNKKIGGYLIGPLGLTGLASSNYLAGWNQAHSANCSGAYYNFNWVGNALSFTPKAQNSNLTGGLIDFTGILNQVYGVLNAQASPTKTFSQLINERIQNCNYSPLGAHLANDVFAAFKALVTGQQYAANN
jgi:hypothetical protein